MTSAYIMSNHDSGTWTLWEARPGSKDAPKQDLVAVDTSNNPINSTSCPANATTSSGVLLPTSVPTDPTTPPPPSVSVGMIAGIAVGASMAVVLFAILLFFLLRRYRKPRRVPEAITTTAETLPTPYDSVPYPNYPTIHELSDDSAVQEVPGASRGSKLRELEAKLSHRVSELEANPTAR